MSPRLLCEAGAEPAGQTARILRAIAGLVVGMSLLSAPQVVAQDTTTRLEFTFSNPGARSMGFGGAFAPLADDATAAFSNPAGLVQLVRPELSGELRLDLANEGADGFSNNIEATGLGFFSFVYPMNRWSVALYGHKLGSLELVPTGTTALRAAPSQPTATQGEFESLGLEIRRYGVACGYEVSEVVSVGVGLSYFEGDVGPLDGGSRLTDADDVGINAGVLWRVDESWKVAGFYREGPRFEVAHYPAPTDPLHRRLSLPDSWGGGAAYRSPGGALTVAFEWARVTYSSLNNLVASAGPGALDDVDELHLGGEFAFLRASPIVALRLGTWLDPAHRVSVLTAGPTGVASDTDELHYATGLGFAWPHFQLDLSADYSATKTSLSISGIVSF